MGDFHYLDRERTPRGPVSAAELARLDAQAKAEGWQLLVATLGSASWVPFSGVDAVPPAPAPSSVPPRAAPPGHGHARPSAPARPNAPAQPAAPAPPAAPPVFAAQPAPYAAPAPSLAIPQPAPFAPRPFAAGAGWVAWLCHVLGVVFALIDFAWLVLGVVKLTEGKPKGAALVDAAFSPFGFGYTGTLVLQHLTLFLLGVALAGFFIWAGRVAGLLNRIAERQRN
jgi:hypothetical protein